ncbi:hypothetical protein KR018_008865 [Drosophila ironensis]|nr:hypothetical protein KR018_008865 [Drosophila ironensis]
MVIKFFLSLVNSLLGSLKRLIMGDSADLSSKKLQGSDTCIVNVPPIAKLGDSHGLWSWLLLITTYLEAIGLWSEDKPKECAKTKFVILSSIEPWVLRREYSDFTCESILKDLTNRFSVKPKNTDDFLF